MALSQKWLILVLENEDEMLSNLWLVPLMPAVIAYAVSHMPDVLINSFVGATGIAWAGLLLYRALQIRS